MILVNGVALVDLAGCEDDSGDRPAGLAGGTVGSPTLDHADLRAER